ncbi:hypothetical protein O6H91_07G085400 [Diphasiastrum complanatum]|uniref:Uncharacterized protein n=1 Tax=Diphasiastrum complanatum TaxID=34168 RepID=A0ACC2D766_DIPCM|nr:hypothetical protein O6H91_07G085400 [Diphasiastrum complanatum]
MSSNNTTDLASQTIGKLGITYGIAIAVGIVVMVSTIMLASYICVRIQGRRQSIVSDQRFRATGTGGHLQYQNIAGEWVIGGLDEATLEAYPKIVFSPLHPLPHAEATSCSICLSDYKEEELLKLLPDCRHVFHAQCIDCWLLLHATCPMCRSSPLPTPLQTTPISTPLSEFIPLARNLLQNHTSQSPSTTSM